MRYRLSLIDKNLYEKVSSIMEFHADIKHINGRRVDKKKVFEEKSVIFVLKTVKLW